MIRWLNLVLYLAVAGLKSRQTLLLEMLVVVCGISGLLFILAGTKLLNDAKHMAQRSRCTEPRDVEWHHRGIEGTN